MLVAAFCSATGQAINLRGKWKFNIGDNASWASPDFSDDTWESIYVTATWEEQGFNGYDGFAWYRVRFDGRRLDKESLYYLNLGYIDDADEAYVNGQMIGFSGQCPPKFKTAYNNERKYVLPSQVIDFEGDNVVAIRVFDVGDRGGMVEGEPGVYEIERARLLLDLRGIWMFATADRGEPLPEDKEWEKIMVPMPWDFQGYSRYDGFAWYRKVVTVPKDFPRETMVLILGKIDDFDEVYFNGKLIGSTNDREPYGWSQSYDVTRAYEIPEGLIVRNGTNVIEVLVEDMGSTGGIYAGIVGITTKRNYERYFRYEN